MALLAVGIPAPAWSQQDHHLGVVGITAGQTAQLNVVNTTPDSGERPCRVSLGFLDTDGHAVGTPEDKSLAPGQAGSVAVADPRIRPGKRLQLRALVRKVDTPDAASDECRGIHATLEVFETKTGKTTVFIGGVATVQAPTGGGSDGPVTPDDLGPFIGTILTLETVTGLTFRAYLARVTGTTSGTATLVSIIAGNLVVSEIPTNQINSFQPS